MRAKDIKKWVHENFNKYIDLMQLTEWEISILIINQSHPANKNNDEMRQYGGVCISGTCRAFYEYKFAKIKLYAKEINNVDHLERVFVHELAHVATSAFFLFAKYFSEEILFTTYMEVAKNIARDINELLAVQLERIILQKDKNYAYVWNSKKELEDDLRTQCMKTKTLDRNVIADTKGEFPTAEQRIWEENKYNADYWYSKWSQSRKLNENKEFEKEDREGCKKEGFNFDDKKENKIVLPNSDDNKEKYYRVCLILPKNFKR